MNRSETDELRHAEVAAQQQMQLDVGRVAHALEAPAREEAERQRHLLRSPLRRIFEGERGAVLLARSIPGFADLWQRIVPEQHVRKTHDRHLHAWDVVRCTCGEHSALRPGNIGECPGACGRFFLHAGRSIRAKRFAV